MDVWGGVIDAVESANEGVVCVGHFSGTYYAVVGCF